MIDYSKSIGDANTVFDPFITSNAFTEDECKFLMDWLNTHEHLFIVGSENEYQGIRALNIFNPIVRHLLDRLTYNVIGQIRTVDSIPVYPEMIAINRWYVGGYQEPHLDTYSSQEIALLESSEGKLEQQLGLKSRMWTCIYYLNDDFGGGQTYIPPCEEFPEGYVHEPVANSGLVFQGIHHLHGVKKVRRCPRYTISMWFTQDPMKMSLGVPTKDLDLNEDTQRIYSLGL